jgi:uncharacterized protein YvpB
MNNPVLYKRLSIILAVLMSLVSLVWGYVILARTPHVVYPQGPIDIPLALGPDKPLVITFDRPINRLIEGQITPKIAGQWRLQSNYPIPLLFNQLAFYPETSLLDGQEYTTSLNNILPAAWIFLDKQAAQYLFVFQAAASAPINAGPLPEIAVISTDPAASASNVLTDKTLIINFNQPLNPNKLPPVINISPAQELTLSTESHSLLATPAGTFTFNQVYQVSVMPPLLPTPYTFSFKTVPYQYKLKVPLYKQHQKFTCFSAAAQMVLGYYDVKVGEISFLDEIGYDQTKRNYLTNVWGDPNGGIVGTYNGSGDGGYGVHWQPVAQALAKHRQVEVLQNSSIAQILSKVKAGYPVIVWWVNGVWPAKELFWNNSQGETIRAVNGMHVEIVTGWAGNQNNPDYIFTNDPWRGFRQYSPETFTTLWRWFNNTAVVVY